MKFSSTAHLMHLIFFIFLKLPLKPCKLAFATNVHGCRLQAAAIDASRANPGSVSWVPVCCCSLEIMQVTCLVCTLKEKKKQT